MFGFDDYVVYVCLDCFADLGSQTCLNHALICCAGVFKSEGHRVEAEWSLRSDECRCGLVCFRHLDLMIARVCVQEAQRIVPCGSIDNLVDAGEREGILRASLVKVIEIDS